MANINRIKILLVIVLLQFGCKEDEIKPAKKDIISKKYSLEIDNLSDPISINNKIDLLKVQIKNPWLVIREDNKLLPEDDLLLIDSIRTYDEAWAIGFNLINESLIGEFKIIFNQKQVVDHFSNFYFIGSYLDRPSIYRVNLISKDFELHWSKWGKDVLGLFRSIEKSDLFFTTALSIGRSGGFPYIIDARLYNLNRVSSTTKLIEKYGNGLQLSAGYIENDIFKSEFLLLDSLKSSNLIRRTSLYKKDLEINRTLDTFEVLSYKQQNNELRLKLSSKSFRFVLKVNSLKDSNNVSIIDNKRGLKQDLCKFIGEISSIKWSDDEKYLGIMIEEVMNSSDSIFASKNNLYMIETESLLVVKKVSGIIPEFLINSCLLFYTKLVDNIGTVHVYDLLNKQNYLTLNIDGGCGINSMSFIE